MTAKTTLPPAAIAREVFRELAKRHAPPTPENYTRVYAEQAKCPLAEVDPAVGVIHQVAEALKAQKASARHAKELSEALAACDWESMRITLRSACVRPPEAAATAPATPAVTIPAEMAPIPATPATPSDAVLKGLFTKTITFLVDERLGYTQAVADEAGRLAADVEAAETAEALEKIAGDLRHFWLKLELHNEGPEPMIRGLSDLLRLLVHNMGDLVVEDKWVQGQVERVQGILSQPLSPKVLIEAERGFKEFLYRQGTLKHSLDEAKAAIRDMMSAFIERLAQITQSTGVFSAKVTAYREQVRVAADLPQISNVLEGLLADTSSIEAETARTHQELEVSRQRVVEQEERIRKLQAELDEVSGLVREDPLTLALNRRGLDQQFGVERARADRKQTPMCLAVLDVDNFKQLNDRLGHAAGDDALKHLASVVRQVLRPTDTLARYGGEEFVILLPETDLDAGTIAMQRVQRELTKRFFMHNNERVLITFSAGIAERRADEAQEALISRADEAMYAAKRAGKNRVEQAE